MPLSSLVERVSAAQLVARANYFSRDATIYDKVTLGAEAVASAIIVLLLILLLIATSRLSGHRVPMCLFCLAAMAFLLERLFDITLLVRSFAWPRVFPTGIYSTWDFMSRFSDAAFGAGVLAIIMDRATAVAGMSHRESIVACGAIAGLSILPFVIMAVARSGLEATTYSASENGELSRSAYRARLVQIRGLGRAAYGFEGLMIVGLLVLSIVVFVKISRRRSLGGKPAKIACCVFVPILVFQLIWQCVFTFADLTHDNLDPKLPLIHYLVFVIGRSLAFVFFLIVAVFLGFKRTLWSTESKATIWPSATPQTQWMYYAPSQQPQFQAPQMGAVQPQVAQPQVTQQYSQAYAQPGVPQQQHIHPQSY